MGLWLAPAVLVVVVAGAPPVRWGDHGHRISGRVAAERLPPGMPAFFRWISGAGRQGIRTPRPSDIIPITAFRCPDCGLLRLYAAEVSDDSPVE